MSEKLNNNNFDDNNSAWLDEWLRIKDEEHDKFKENAAQELVEREMNSELTKVEDLKLAIEAGEKGIMGAEAEIPFKDGSKHNIYLMVLKGYPFKTLQSNITYENVLDVIGVDNEALNKTGDNLRQDPAVWMKKKDEVEGLGKSASAVFSASYYDTEVGVPEMMGGYCSYGFDHVRPNTVVSIIKGDSGTTPVKEFMAPDFWYSGQSETTPIPLEELADVGHSIWTRFNEVVVNRYDELGNPQKPDYILIKGKENLNSLAIKHAEYHNIPLICIMPEYYKEIKVEDDIEWDPDWDQDDEED